MGQRKSKKPLSFEAGRLFIINLATTYSRGTYRTTTIGKAAFDGRVRDGIGSGHSFMVTKNWVTLDLTAKNAESTKRRKPWRAFRLQERTRAETRVRFLKNILCSLIIAYGGIAGVFVRKGLFRI